MAMEENMPGTLDGAMYHGKSAQSAGGVGRNLAESIYKLYGKVNFISLIGKDIIGDILRRLIPVSLSENIERIPKYRTSSCTVIIDKNGDCKLILGDMEIHEHFHYRYVMKRKELLHKAPLVVIDGNLPMDTIASILKEAQQYKIPVFFEPTDLRISGKPFRNLSRTLTQQIRIVTPNYAELENLLEAACPEFKHPKIRPDFGNTEKLLKSVKCMLIYIGHMFDCIVVTLGQHGVVLCLNSSIDPYQCSMFKKHRYIVDTSQPAESNKRIIFFPTPYVIKNVVNVSGAGDSFAGGFISGLLKEYTITQSLALGFMAASKALQTASAVPREYFEPGYDKQSQWLKRMDALTRPGNANEQNLA
ncbi:uncharacterized protein LOC142231280 [Haematobia irritans]|uniref:uncharacterized protein LOC142231280 n=1 Tax=Haematobia irritans TaxID=7368 RepID=UPI003F500FA8